MGPQRTTQKSGPGARGTLLEVVCLSVLCFHRGVDQTTYCDYALEFIIHVHGLRLSPKLAIFILQVTTATLEPPPLLVSQVCVAPSSLIASFFFMNVPHACGLTHGHTQAFLLFR